MRPAEPRKPGRGSPRGQGQCWARAGAAPVKIGIPRVKTRTPAERRRRARQSPGPRRPRRRRRRKSSGQAHDGRAGDSLGRREADRHAGHAARRSAAHSGAGRRRAGPAAAKAGRRAAQADRACTRARGVLQARYPQIFSWGRPLAIGIDQKLRGAFTEEELPTADLKVFLRTWVHRKAYRAALARGDRRVNLDGSDAGPAFDDPTPAVEERVNG